MHAAAPAPIFSERVQTLALLHSALPPPRSAGRLQADTVVGRLILQDMPERNVMLEAYSAKKSGAARKVPVCESDWQL